MSSKGKRQFFKTTFKNVSCIIKDSKILKCETETSKNAVLKVLYSFLKEEKTVCNGSEIHIKRTFLLRRIIQKLFPGVFQHENIKSEYLEQKKSQ